MTRAETLPHGYPFRLVERAEPRGDGRVAVVLATADAQLHRSAPWPVTLVVEALAQAILLVVNPSGENDLRLVGLDKVRLYGEVVCGERLEVAVVESAAFGALRRYACRALAGGALVATAEVTVTG